MSRVPRRFQWAEEACFHLIDRGPNREPVFLDDEDRRAFLGLVARYKRRFGFRLYHYCLMTNHIHLLVRLDEPAQVSPLMAGLLRAYAHHRRRRHRFTGHGWGGRFKSPAIQVREYLLSCGRYAERNPVEAGMVRMPWDYPWSSARALALGEADGLVDENPEYLALADTPRRRQELWRGFLVGDDPREDAARREDGAVGDAAFLARLLQAHGRPAPRRRGRPPNVANPVA
jgi:putative transposase